MLCIHSKTIDPCFNLAAEEYLLKNSGEDVFMIWQSTPAVVVGKHQNTLAEINYRFIRDNNIRIARRLTGGGAVYHDAGNINFSFIRQGEQGKLVNFAGFIEPITRFLTSVDIEANRGLKNEILVNGKKISGNAEHVYKNRVLHHGTLLYNTDLHWLSESIRPGNGKYTDKAVQSNKGNVLNLAGCINPVMSVGDFQEALMDYVMKNYQGRKFEFEADQIKAIQLLAVEKYCTWEWIYGWSPDYEFNNIWRLNNHEMVIKLKTHRGIINSCTLKSREITTDMEIMVNDRLRGIAHEEGNIRAMLEISGLRSILDNKEFEDLLPAFF
jgi:lipoate-protein ligase A